MGLVVTDAMVFINYVCPTPFPYQNSFVAHVNVYQTRINLQNFVLFFTWFNYLHDVIFCSKVQNARPIITASWGYTAKGL